ncbi:MULTISPECIES: ABC transporter ATP-binding protein [Cohnella]|uniref:ABC transporter ATP-binding protein n=1 Tax=Cohnella TaxID=329857 RepID=UPI0009BC6CA7|nr:MULTISPECIES: ABC transporter ATP-binding protein [Cohnella]MBN2982525.1 ABC transporter ATP-binding protein [Cohnella algarum]
MSGKSIVLDQVEKVYDTRTGPLHALSRMSLSLEAGSFVSVVGPSGCGKSTLMNLMAGLDSTPYGSIRINGEEIDGPVDGNAVVFQKDVLLDWRNVIDNVLLPLEIQGVGWWSRPNRKTNRERAQELLELVGLKGFENKYPYELSGGMRQRVSICRALIQEPELLFMDEPFGALDALTREQMMYDLLKIFAKYRFTCIFITHSIEEAVFLSDRVLVMSNRPGRVVEDILVDLPRPRNSDTRIHRKFSEHVNDIRSIFKAQGILSEL